MYATFSDARDNITVGAFFGFVAGLVAMVVALLWTLVTRLHANAPPFLPILALHAGHLVVYALAGGLIGFLWPTRRSLAGHWVLWFLATATGALTVNSVAYGPSWTWSFQEWGYYALMAVLFTPVLATSNRRRK